MSQYEPLNGCLGESCWMIIPLISVSVKMPCVEKMEVCQWRCTAPSVDSAFFVFAAWSRQVFHHTRKHLCWLTCISLLEFGEFLPYEAFGDFGGHEGINGRERASPSSAMMSPAMRLIRSGWGKFVLSHGESGMYSHHCRVIPFCRSCIAEYSEWERVSAFCAA
jgi:hypothetical protein